MKSAILSVTKFPTLSLCYMAVLISSSPQESTFPNRIRKRISRRIPAYDGMFLLCYGDETPGSVKPSGEHDSRFGGGSSEWFAQRNVLAWAGIRRTFPFLTHSALGRFFGMICTTKRASMGGNSPYISLSNTFCFWKLHQNDLHNETYNHGRDPPYISLSNTLCFGQRFIHKC